MSQIDLENPAVRDAADDETAVDEVLDASAQSTATQLRLLRPTPSDPCRGRSTLIERTRTDTDDDPDTSEYTRNVGGQYLLQNWLTAAPFVLLDLAMLTCAIAIAREFVLYFQMGTGINISGFFPPIATGFLLVSAELGLYPGIRLSPVEEFRRLAVAVTSIFAMWTVGVAMLAGGLSINQITFLAIACGLSIVSLPVARSWSRRILAKCSWWGFPTLVCGDDSAAVRVYDWLSSNRSLGLRPVGLIADPDVVEIDVNEPWYAGPWSAAHDVAVERGVYWAVVVPPEDGGADLATSITEHLSTIPHIHVLSELSGLTDHWSPHRQLDGLTGTHLQQNLMLPLPRLTKRLLDLGGALVGGILLLPLLFYLAVAVKLSSRGPVLYGHDRIGKGGRHFRAWKFRSMFENANDVLEFYLEQHPELKDEWEQDQKLKHDPRVTRIGRFMRRTSLDELPQLWNVIRGEMTLVGPRPIVTSEIEKYGPYYGLYTMVLPGITGLWQVSGRNNTTYDERVQLDAYYVRNWSFWLDVYLLLRTVRIVLFSKGAY